MIGSRRRLGLSDFFQRLFRRLLLKQSITVRNFNATNTPLLRAVGTLFLEEFSVPMKRVIFIFEVEI